MAGELQGRTILITRSQRQAAQFREMLEELGSKVLEVPSIEILPRSASEIDPVANLVDRWQWLVFTSANAVRIFLERCQELETLAHLSSKSRPFICAVGPATSNAIRSFGVDVDLLPESFHAEGVLEALEQRNATLDNLRILLPIASAATDILPIRLWERGADVTVLPVYDTLPPKGSRSLLQRMLIGGDPDLVAVTSSSTVRNFVTLCRPGIDPTRFSYAAIGPVTAKTCVELGIPPAVQASESTVPGLVRAIRKYFDGRYG